VRVNECNGDVSTAIRLGEYSDDKGSDCQTRSRTEGTIGASALSRAVATDCLTVCTSLLLPAVAVT
jgi:hypothetical protein